MPKKTFDIFIEMVDYNSKLGILTENNVRVAELSASTYLSRWTDSRSEIGTIRKRIPYGSSVRIAELQDSK